jgi:hypothetical protein
MAMRIAILADIHANLSALEAVIELSSMLDRSDSLSMAIHVPRMACFLGMTGGGRQSLDGSVIL